MSMNLYVVDIERWIPFYVSEQGGVMVIKAKDEKELVDFIKDETRHFPHLKPYDKDIEENIKGIRGYEIPHQNSSGKVRTWIT